MLRIKRETQPSLFPRVAPVWLALSAFLCAILAVNPLRETAMEDDWAYAWTVQHWLATGNYHLNDWLSANMPFQAAWGTLFSLVSGYSFTTVRFFTSKYPFWI